MSTDDILKLVLLYALPYSWLLSITCTNLTRTQLIDISRKFSRLDAMPTQHSTKSCPESILRACQYCNLENFRITVSKRTKLLQKSFHEHFNGISLPLQFECQSTC